MGLKIYTTGAKLPTITLIWFKLQRHAIDTVSQPRRLWPIRKDVAKMPVAAIAMHFGATHEQTAVILFADRFLIHRLIERGPPGAAVELVRLIKQTRATSLAGVLAWVFREIVVGKRALRSMFAQNLVLKIIKLGAPVLV